MRAQCGLRAREHRRSVAGERADDRFGGFARVDDRLREVMDLQLGSPGGVPQQAESTVHLEADPLAEDALRLLDDDSRVECMLQLVGALAPVGFALRIVHPSAPFDPENTIRGGAGEQNQEARRRQARLCAKGNRFQEEPLLRQEPCHTVQRARRRFGAWPRLRQPRLPPRRAWRHPKALRRQALDRLSARVSRLAPEPPPAVRQVHRALLSRRGRRHSPCRPSSVRALPPCGLQTVRRNLAGRASRRSGRGRDRCPAARRAHRTTHAHAAAPRGAARRAA